MGLIVLFSAGMTRTIAAVIAYVNKAGSRDLML